jgi:diaminopimelate epimerase
MRLFRSHGLGNDYLVLEEGTLTPALVRAVCDRHEGVGADGVLEPIPAPEGADHAVRIYNPDGSEAEKSGNGLRIFADWLVRTRGVGPRFTVWTRGGIVRCEVDQGVRVAMGHARILGVDVLAGVAVTRVDVGNPHAVVRGIPADWERIGAAIEHAVPGRTNVQFVEFDAQGARARIWERGAGRTRSSGSSACAIAAVAVQAGWARSPVTVRMEGGSLRITVDSDNSVTLEGPVEPIGRIEVDTGWLERRSGSTPSAPAA